MVLKKNIYTLIVIFFLLGITAPARADLEVSEGALNPDGTAYEINPDGQGWLWISDFDAGQIWGLDVSGGYFEIYPLIYDDSDPDPSQWVWGAPSDARRVGSDLWWADGKTGVLGRVSTEDGAYTLWRVEGADGFYGTAVDEQGRLWATDSAEPYLYRLDADAGELCTFSLPQSGKLYYLLHQAGYLYAGDDVNDRLLRLKVSDNTLDWWQLPADSSILGLTMDGEGDVWYADSVLNLLAELVPGENQLSSYPLPQSAEPAMLAAHEGRLWFSSDLDGRIGILDPEVAAPSVSTLDMGSENLAPSCSDLSVEGTGFFTITIEDFIPDPTTYETVVNSGGWHVYQMSASAVPWGITTLDGMVYVVDNGRQVLVQAEGFIEAPSLSIDKSAAPATYDAVGDVINYEYLVTNTGNVVLYNVSVVDDKASDESCPSTAAGLLPQAQITCTASHTVTQADLDAGSLTNSAYATDGSISSMPDTATVTAVKKPALGLQKSGAPGTFREVGDQINYEYRVINAGNVTLFNITVIDDKTTVDCPSTAAGLAPKAQITCTASYTITQADLDAGSVTNIAHATDGSISSGEASFTVIYNADEERYLFLPMIIR